MSIIVCVYTPTSVLDGAGQLSADVAVGQHRGGDRDGRELLLRMAQGEALLFVFLQANPVPHGTAPFRFYPLVLANSDNVCVHYCLWLHSIGVVGVVLRDGLASTTRDAQVRHTDAEARHRVCVGLHAPIRHIRPHCRLLLENTTIAVNSSICNFESLLEQFLLQLELHDSPVQLRHTSIPLYLSLALCVCVCVCVCVARPVSDSIDGAKHTTTLNKGWNALQKS
jgi:hypothetical protein